MRVVGSGDVSDGKWGRNDPIQYVIYNSLVELLCINISLDIVLF